MFHFAQLEEGISSKTEGLLPFILSHISRSAMDKMSMINTLRYLKTKKPSFMLIFLNKLLFIILHRKRSAEKLLMFKHNLILETNKKETKATNEKEVLGGLITCEMCPIKEQFCCQKQAILLNEG